MGRSKLPKWTKIVEVLAQERPEKVSVLQMLSMVFDKEYKTKSRRTDFSYQYIGLFLHAYFGNKVKGKYYIRPQRLFELCRKTLKYIPDSKPCIAYIGDYEKSLKSINQTEVYDSPKDENGHERVQGNKRKKSRKKEQNMEVGKRSTRRSRTKR